MDCFAMFRKDNAKKDRVLVMHTDPTDLNSLSVGIDNFFRKYSRNIGKLRKCSLITQLLKTHGMTLLGLGSHICSLNLVTILLEKGADANEHSVNGLSPLLILCSQYPHSYPHSSTHLTIARLLLKHKAEVNRQNSRGETSLHLACQLGLVNLVALLIDAGSDVNICDVDGNTSLSDICKRTSKYLTYCFITLACQECQLYKSWLDISILLLKAGADPKQGTLLPFAVLFCSLDAVQELIDLGMDVNMKDNCGRSPLEYISDKVSDVFRIKKEFLENAIYISDTYTFIQVLFENEDVNDTYKFIKILLENGADVRESSEEFKIWLLTGILYSKVSIDNLFHFLSYGATFSSQEMAEVACRRYTTWFKQYGDAKGINQSSLVPWHVLFKAGFRQWICALIIALLKMQCISGGCAVGIMFYVTVIYSLTLADLCRMTVRSHLHHPIDHNVDRLPLPNSLKDFLKFKEFKST